MVRDAILNINTYFMTIPNAVSSDSLAIRRGIANPEVRGSNLAATILFLNIIKLLTEQNNSNAKHNNTIIPFFPFKK